MDIHSPPLAALLALRLLAAPLPGEVGAGAAAKPEATPSATADAGVAREAGFAPDAPVAGVASAPDAGLDAGALAAAADSCPPDGGQPPAPVARAEGTGGPGAVDTASAVDQGNDDDDGSDEEAGEAESESAQAQAGGDGGIRYSRDLPDEKLQQRWQQDPPSLGSISVGFADQGRVINAVHLDDGDAWVCARRDLAWGTRETVDALVAAFRAVRAQFPDSAPARLSHIGLQDGGYLRPHRSHQSGRDADIGFFYRGDQRPGGRAKNIAKAFDAPRNWALIRALITESDVQVIWVDRGIQKLLRAQALASGEDGPWVDRIFRDGKGSIVQHARRHHDHFHIRFYAPRSQELGRRIQPLLAQRPEHNLAVHRVRGGQTLGHIARAYGVSVPAIMKANRMKKSFLRVGQNLFVPLHGPCTKCPLPPAVEVPPRCLPPQPRAAG